VREREIGVYQILNLVTGRRYIGGSVVVSQRWREHWSMLQRGSHYCKELQRDWNFFGPEGFGFQVLDVVESRADLRACEQRHLDEAQHLYNATRITGTGPPEGFRQSEVTKAKLRETGGHHRRGSHLSPTHRQILRDANIGRQKSEAEREKLRQALTGRVISWGDKISAAKKGQPLSPQAKEAYDRSRAVRALAISAGKRGRPWSSVRREAHLRKRSS